MQLTQQQLGWLVCGSQIRECHVGCGSGAGGRRQGEQSLRPAIDARLLSLFMRRMNGGFLGEAADQLTR
jgi:hypothetical protein